MTQRWKSDLKVSFRKVSSRINDPVYLDSVIKYLYS